TETAGPTRSPIRPASSTPTSTFTPTPIPTPTPTPTPTATSAPPPTQTAPPTRTTRPTPTASSAASPSTSSAAQASSETAGFPAWGWFLVALLVLAGAAVPLIVRARRRRAWRAELAACEEEVAWLARVLLPQLRQAGAAEQVAGGWAVSEGRVSAVEDRLTALEASAPDEAGRARARTLRDAVRSSRERM